VRVFDHFQTKTKMQNLVFFFVCLFGGFCLFFASKSKEKQNPKKHFMKKKEKPKKEIQTRKRKTPLFLFSFF
jgi:hypothetical protein